MKEICQQLRNRLAEAVHRHGAEGILLSGGLDTTILAFLAKPKKAFTVALKGSAAPDLPYAGTVAKCLGMEHAKMEFSAEEALATLPEVIRILRTFDLALPNDLSIYFALKLAAQNNVTSVMTGDGSDELFAGYSFMAGLSPHDLATYIVSLRHSWHFSSSELGKALSVEVRQPFLDDKFVQFALGIDPQLKVKDGVGKYILRKSFEDLIPTHIVWRKKEPIECGSGSTKLRELINSLVEENEFQAAIKETNIKFINKEHFFYWRVYREAVGEIPSAGDEQKKCPCCGAEIGIYHCRICGFSLPLEQAIKRANP